MEKQSDAEVIQQWKAFLGSSEGSNVVADDYNGQILADYLKEHNQGVISYAALCRAVKDFAVLNRLHLKIGRCSANMITAKAEEERQQNEADRVNQIAADWVNNCCPRGLLLGSDLYDENSNRLVAYIMKHGGKVSLESLSDAVRHLIETNSLVWLSEDRELRNQPATPPRKLSRQAQIDAGMIPDDSVSKLRSHTNNASLVNPADKMRETVKRLFPDNPWELKANLLVITDRRGRIDQSKTADLRRVIVKRNDKTDWELTYKKRNEICDGADRLRNRD